MNHDEAVKKVIAVAVDQLGVDESDVSESSSFVGDLGADSLDLVELVMAFEDEFGVSIPDDQVEAIATVADAANYIVSQS